MRLDVFLKRTGLAKQRTLAKESCDRGLVKVDGREAKASKEIGPGAAIGIATPRGALEIEVTSLPERNYKRKEGEAFYRIKSQVSDEPDEIF